jgi:photosystem II stability/assembly factor-like uncharacterized protein
MYSYAEFPYKHYFLKTTNGGLSWESVNPIPDLIVDYYDEIFIINETTGIIAFRNGSYSVTYDKGNTWEYRNEHFATSSRHTQLSVFDESIMYWSGRDGIYRSDDQGQNWNRVLDNNYIYSLYMTDIDKGYAIEKNFVTDSTSLLITGDGWNSYNSSYLDEDQIPYIEIIAPINDRLIFLIGGDKVYFSMDGGTRFSYYQELEAFPYKVKEINGLWFVYGRSLASYRP